MSSIGTEGFITRGERVPEEPVVSVIVPMLDDPVLALRCLDSLAELHGSVPSETIVVANGTPGAALRTMERRSDVVLVRSRVNLGFAGGNNLAAAVARGRYLLLLNDDSTVSPGLVDRLVATVERDPAIGAVGSRIVSEDGSLQEAGSVLWSDGWVAHVGLGDHVGTGSYSYVRDVDYTSANGLLVRRSAWDAVGGLDEGYFPAYYEDVELCMSLRRHGYRVVFEPRAEVVHLESQSTSSGFRGFLLTRNRARFTARWANELAEFDPRPGEIDDVAIERGVQRARGYPPRVLVVAGPAPDAGTGDLVEELAVRGWAVTLADGPPAAGSGTRTTSPPRADRFIDLGVDVRSDPVEDILRVTGSEIEVVLIGTTRIGACPPFVRADGTAIPVLMLTGAGGAAVTADTVAEAARRRPAAAEPESPSSIRRTGADTDAPPPASGAVTATDGQPDGSLRESFAASTQFGREERALAADREVRGSYVELLEKQLDVQTAYLEKLWSLRCKLWLTDLLGRLRPGRPGAGGGSHAPGAVAAPSGTTGSRGPGGPDRPLRILMVAESFPWPSTGGGLIRLAKMIEAVSELGEVDLFAVADRERTDFALPPSVQLHRLRTVGYPGARPHWRWRAAWLTQAREPLEVVMRASDPTPRRVFEAWAADRYDVVWFSTAAMFAWTGRPHLGPTIIDLMDLEDVKADQHSELVREAGSTRGLTARTRRAVAGIQAAKNAHDWRAFQRSVAGQADRVVLCSGADVERSGLANAVEIPNSYARPERSVGHAAVGHPPVILLQGSLNYAPNMDAVDWLLDEIAPHLWERVPDAQIRLVGKPAPGVRRRDRRPLVTVVGQVPDMEPELARADLAVVPLRMGSGTRLKILESFAHRIPVVSTTVGADGLDVRGGVHLLLADDPVSFADACRRLLTDSDLRTRLVDAAQHLYLERYEWSTTKERVQALVRDVAGPEPTGRRT